MDKKKDDPRTIQKSSSSKSILKVFYFHSTKLGAVQFWRGFILVSESLMDADLIFELLEEWRRNIPDPELIHTTSSDTERVYFSLL
jgi:hypothetical protein